MSRLEQLIRFMQEDPKDPFNIYALALEYQKLDPQRALDFFKVLIRDHNDYVPTYYHLAKLYAQLGFEAEAIETLRTGIEKARAQNEMKALRELRAALDELVA